MTTGAQLDRIRDGGLDDAIDETSPRAVVLAMAELARRRAGHDSGYTADELERAAKLLAGVDRRVPTFGERKPGVAQLRQARQLLEPLLDRRVDLDAIAAAAADYSRDLAVEAADDGDAAESDEWTRCAKLFEWIEDKLQDIGIVS